MSSIDMSSDRCVTRQMCYRSDMSSVRHVPRQTCLQTDVSMADVSADSHVPRVEQLELRVCFSFLGEPRGPLTAFTFSQNDMCLVFVAFATWAVRTSDLHTPDAWKTGLGAQGDRDWCPESRGGTVVSWASRDEGCLGRHSFLP